MSRPMPRKHENAQPAPVRFDNRIAGLSERRINFVTDALGLRSQAAWPSPLPLIKPNFNFTHAATG